MATRVVVDENGDLTNVEVATSEQNVVVQSTPASDVVISLSTNAVVVSSNPAANVVLTQTTSPVNVSTTATLVNITNENIDAAFVAYVNRAQTFTKPQVIHVGSAADIPLTLRGFSGQSEPLLQILDPSGTPLGDIAPNGFFNFISSQFAIPSDVSKSAASQGVASTISRSDHKHDVNTATASALTTNSTNTEGSSVSLARADHTHAITANVAPANIIKQTASAGSSTAFARADHLHDITTAVANTISPDAVAAEGTATSLARSDHTHAITCATPSTVLKQSNAEGSASSFARSDHLHDISTAVVGSSAVGDSALEGTATSLARSDHRHGREAFGATTALLASAAAAGSAVTPSRSDHVHAWTGLLRGTDFTRTVPTTVGQYVQLGSFTITNGAHAFKIFITVSDSGFSVSKSYIITPKYDDITTWTDVNPITDSGAYSSNNFALEVNVTTTVVAFRLRRTQGSTAGTANVFIEYGYNAIYSSASGTGTSTSSGVYHSAVLTQTGGAAFVGTNQILTRGDFTGTPTTISPDDVASGGSATSVARSDHLHAIVAAVAGASAVGDTAIEGVATSFARSDHRHSRESFGNVVAITTFNVASANGTASTVARSDHNHGIPAHDAAAHNYATPVTVQLNDTTIGTRPILNFSLMFSATDDAGGTEVDIGLNTAAPNASSPGDAQAAGSANSLARSDHVHAREAYGVANTVLGSPSGGSLTSIARSDHVHSNILSNGIIFPFGTEAVESYIGSFFTGNQLSNYDLRGATVSTALTGTATITFPERLFRAHGDGSHEATISGGASGGTVEVTASGISLETMSRAWWRPFIKGRTSLSSVTTIKFEVQGQDNSWQTITTDNAPTYYGGTSFWIGPEYNMTSQFPPKGVRVTFTVTASSTSRVREIGLQHRNNRFLHLAVPYLSEQNIFLSNATGSVPVTIKGISGQTADLLKLTNSSDQSHFAVSTSRLFFTATAGASVGVHFESSGGANNTGVLIKNTADGTTSATLDHNGLNLKGDVEITDSAKGCILKSPNGTRWRVTIDNNGSLTSTSL